MIDPGPALRVLVVVALVGGELACALTAPRREDGTYGLARPSVRSRYALTFVRELRTGELVPVGADGTWLARDGTGTLRRLRVGDRVREPALTAAVGEVSAPWGRARALRFLQAGIDDVAGTAFEDAETARLRLEVTFDDGARVTLASGPFPRTP